MNPAASPASSKPGMPAAAASTASGPKIDGPDTISAAAKRGRSRGPRAALRSRRSRPRSVARSAVTTQRVRETAGQGRDAYDTSARARASRRIVVRPRDAAETCRQRPSGAGRRAFARVRTARAIREETPSAAIGDASRARRSVRPDGSSQFEPRHPTTVVGRQRPANQDAFFDPGACRRPRPRAGGASSTRRGQSDRRDVPPP